ncbi:MAG: imelysin family protein [Alphaproteobacteria bacterium]|nr:imelysin family protein [Alphaproteobacteria bacterium]MCB9695940.1 imelysin family protein [Alphaproteobacteria bacterium]
MIFIFYGEAAMAARWRAEMTLVGGLAGLALTRSIACGTGGPAEVDPDVAALLADFGPLVVIPAVERATTSASALQIAIDDWAAAPSDDDARQAAQQAFLEAVGAWEPLEMAQVGPAASSLDAVGGQDLRDEILSYPTVNACRVDQLTAEGAYAQPAFFEENLVTSRGLDALDRLLFADDVANACGEEIDINVEGTWTALGSDEIRARRAAYASVLAHRLVEDLGRLSDAWVADDFAGQLAAAGGEGSPYDTADQALQDVFGALFALETSTQDRKLGRVLGLRDCDAATCPEDTLLPWSGASQDWIVADLAGFRVAFTGGEGAGLDDLLAARGHQDVVDELLLALDGADAAAAALALPVEEAADSDPATALALHTAITAVTEILETDVATILTLQLPTEVAGDND